MLTIIFTGLHTEEAGRSSEEGARRETGQGKVSQRTRREIETALRVAEKEGGGQSETEAEAETGLLQGPGYW